MDSSIVVPGVQVRLIDPQKGRGLFATKVFNKGDIILEEMPLISCQFAWNKTYKYAACDFCMLPLESVEENVRRLSGEKQLILPYADCHPAPRNIVHCSNCNTQYCSDICKDTAFHLYHQLICHNNNDSAHPLEVLVETWKHIHYPPETVNIMLFIRILAMIQLSSHPETLCNKLNQFCHRTISNDAQFAFLGGQFVNQLELLRELTAKVISGPYVDQFLTYDGFRALLALIGLNGQGVGTSPMAEWVNKVTVLPIEDDDKNKLDIFINELYDSIDKESGNFLNTEGSGLYQIQSLCNHSCLPNTETAFPYSNHCLQLKALKTINVGDEILISYLHECTLGRSRHSRQKELISNYLFTCACEKCHAQIDDLDETSAEEMSEDDEVEDMSD